LRIAQDNLTYRLVFGCNFFIFKFYFGLLVLSGSLWNVLFWRTSIAQFACPMSPLELMRVGCDKRVDWVVRVVWGMLVNVDLFLPGLVRLAWFDLVWPGLA